MSQKFECLGKKPYDSKEEVDHLIFQMIYESAGGVGDLRSYKCKYCGKWHLTSKVK